MRSSWLKARRYGYQTNDCASDGSTRHEQIQVQYIITAPSAFLLCDPCPTSPNGFQARNPKLADIRHLGSDCSCVDTASCINFFCFCFFFCLRRLTRLRNAKQSGSSTQHNKRESLQSVLTRSATHTHLTTLRDQICAQPYATTTLTELTPRTARRPSQHIRESATPNMSARSPCERANCAHTSFTSGHCLALPSWLGVLAHIHFSDRKASLRDAITPRMLKYDFDKPRTETLSLNVYSLPMVFFTNKTGRPTLCQLESKPSYISCSAVLTTHHVLTPVTLLYQKNSRAIPRAAQGCTDSMIHDYILAASQILFDDPLTFVRFAVFSAHGGETDPKKTETDNLRIFKV